MACLKTIDPEELLRRVEEVHERYPKGLSCSEKVFLVVHSLLESDISSDSVALMSGFGGGVAGTRDNMCGAVSSGVAAIGLVYGRRSPPDGSAERAYEVSKDFVGRLRPNSEPRSAVNFSVIYCEKQQRSLRRRGAPDAPSMS